MVSVVLGLRQVLVWAGELVQADQEKEGGRGTEGGSDNTSRSSEEGERGKEHIEMFHSHPETEISSQRNVYQVWVM